MTNYPLVINEKDTRTIRKIALELNRLTNKINRDRFEGKVPEAADTILALELSDVLNSFLMLDDMDVYFETTTKEGV